jgi:hypothetical protein
MPSALDLFLDQAPCCVLARLAIVHLFDHDRLDRLFEDVADRQYHRELLFSEVLHLMLQVVFRTHKSVNAAYRAAADLGVSHQAVYDKLRRLDDSVSDAVVADSAAQVRATLDALGTARPEPVPGYRLRVVDGNLLAATQRRLKPLRSHWSRGLPGRVLAVYEPAADLVTHAFLERDGHASERSRLPAVLALAGAGELWVADSHFCTHAAFAALRAAGAAFLVRQHGAMTGELLGKRRSCGRTATGAVYEQSLRMMGGNDGVVVRRLTLELDTPTRGDDAQVHVLTDVPAAAASAVVLVEAYRQRRFYEVAQTLNAEPHTLAYPAAALFAFCLGLAASNAAALLRAALRAAHPEGDNVAEMSNHYVAEEVQRTYAGMMIAVPAAAWEAQRCATPESLAVRLRAVAARVDPKRYRRSKRGAKKPTTKRPYRNGHTLSTQRLLDQQNPKRPP